VSKPGKAKDAARASAVHYYGRMRAAVAGALPVGGRGRGSAERARKAEVDARADAALAGLVPRIMRSGDFDQAVLSTVRELIAAPALPRARSFAQVLQRRHGIGELGDMAMALVAIADPMRHTAWTLLLRNRFDYVLQTVPVEYFRLGFLVEPERTREVLREVLTSGAAVRADAAAWLDIARTSFVSGAEDLSAQALARAEQELARPPAGRQDELRTEIAWLRSWHGRAGRTVATVPGEIAVAVLDYSRPDSSLSRQVAPDDALTSMAAVGHLVRRTGLQFTGDAALVELAEATRRRVPAARVVPGDRATVRLFPVDRDASSYAAVPDGTWLIACGAYVEQLAGLRYDLPLDGRLRPIFLGAAFDPRALAAPGAVDHLRRYAPIGCRDWSTVALLRAAGVPAFFSGWIESTLDVLGGAPDAALDVRAADGLAAAAVGELDTLAGRSRVTTSRTGVYLAARSLGASVRFTPKNPQSPALDGLLDVTPAAFDRLRGTMCGLLEKILGAVFAGTSEDGVYALWRELTAVEVERARVRSEAVGDIAPPSFDVAAACRAVRQSSVVVERTEAGPAGSEINLEFSLDSNFKHQLDVVLDSIVRRASRPVRAFVLCRDHTQDDYDRMARIFPTVSFVWLPMDRVEYGRVVGMLGHITVATMDRLLLPDLLPEVDRILHHDLDALCLADLAELFDVDLHGHPVAARNQEHPNGGSGFVSLRRAAEFMPADLARSSELIVRTHRRHAFDFQVFNAGIMVLDLARLRADEFCRHYLPYVERYGFNDQAVLNAYAGSDREPLEPAWNTYPRFEIAENAKILHWLGPIKPWKGWYVQGRPAWRRAEAQTAQRIARHGG
jgi:lipopolysaccharide biosynthesis glycosyltransferase